MDALPSLVKLTPAKLTPAKRGRGREQPPEPPRDDGTGPLLFYCSKNDGVGAGKTPLLNEADRNECGVADLRTVGKVEVLQPGEALERGEVGNLVVVRVELTQCVQPLHPIEALQPVRRQAEHAQLSQPSAAPAPVPAPKPHNPAWTEQVNPENSQKYYWNSQTGESTYSRPADYNPPPGSRPMGERGPSQKGPPGANLFVVRKMRRGEFDEFTDRDLRAEFEKFGPLLRCEITLDRETGQSRGFGFVSFTCVEHADAAIAALHRQVVMGRTMNIEKTSDERDRVDKYAPLNTANTVTYS